MMPGFGVVGLVNHKAQKKVNSTNHHLSSFSFFHANFSCKSSDSKVHIIVASVSQCRSDTRNSSKTVLSR